MLQNSLYEQKRRWQRIFLFFFLLFLTGVLIPGGCASGGKKASPGRRGIQEIRRRRCFRRRLPVKWHMEMTWLCWMHPIRRMVM